MCTVLAMSKRFKKRLILHTAQIPAKKPNFGGMQYQSFLKTLRHCEYITNLSGKDKRGKLKFNEK